MKNQFNYRDVKDALSTLLGDEGEIISYDITEAEEALRKVYTGLSEMITSEVEENGSCPFAQGTANGLYLLGNIIDTLQKAIREEVVILRQNEEKAS